MLGSVGIDCVYQLLPNVGSLFLHRMVKEFAMKDFDAWMAFRAGERYVGSTPICCLCCGEASGDNIDMESGEPVCDDCIDAKPYDER